MARIKRGVISRKRHRKIIKQVKGFRGSQKHRIKSAKESLLKAGNFAYRDRRTKKRVFRSSFIVCINNALKEHDLKYSEFIALLKKAKIELDRKVLADLAKNHKEEFDKVVDKVKK